MKLISNHRLVSKIGQILIVGLLVAILVVAYTLPAFAADDKSTGLKVGDKIQVDNGVEVTYLGANPDGTRNWKAKFGMPQYLDDLKTPIHASWLYDIELNEFTSDANLFTATVRETAVTVDYKGKCMSWNPFVFVGTKAQSPSYASLCIQDPINENYYGNTLQWWYGDIYRNLRIIEGMLIEYYTIDSMPADFVRIIPNTVRDADFAFVRDIEIWDAEGNPVEFLIDDAGAITLTVNAMKEAIFPITIDPDTSFTTSSSDGYSYYHSSGAGSEAAAWNEMHDTATGSYSSSQTALNNYLNTYSGGASASGRVYRSFLYFSTGSLPDGCVINSSTLHLYVYNKYTDMGATDIIIQGGMPTYPHDPLVGADFNYTYYSGDYGQLNTSSITAGAYNSWTLTASGKTAISKTATTKFVIREEKHDEDDLQATWPGSATNWYNGIAYWSYEKGSGYWPYLEVTYTAAADPTINTNAASSIATTTARLNSTVVDDGGGDVTVRFGWGLTSEATIEAYDDYDTVAGTFNSGEHPYLDVDSLVADTLYYFSVEGTNDHGTTLGGELDFTTANAISDPTNLVAFPQSTYVSLTWDAADGASQYMVRYRNDTYPTTEADGTEVYFGTSTSTTHTGLSIGDTYYYSVWGESGGAYSTNYAYTLTTTSAADTAGGGLETPTTPARWLAAPDYTNMVNLLILYDAVNGTADSLGMPRETLWFMLAMLFSVGFGIAIYIVTKFKMLPAMIAMIIAMAFGWTIKLIPFWIPLMAIILLVAVKVGHKEVEY